MGSKEAKSAGGSSATFEEASDEVEVVVVDVVNEEGEVMFCFEGREEVLLSFLELKTLNCALLVVCLFTSCIPAL